MVDVIVIGGGVIGLSIARELAGSKSVLLLDRGSTGQGTSSLDMKGFLLAALRNRP